MIDNQSPSGTVVSSSLGRGNASSVDIIKQLDKLEELIEDSVQFLGRALFINTEQFFTYTNKIRAFLPEELKWASRYSQESERMMLESETQARTAIVAAQEQARMTISAAEAQARQALDAAQAEAQHYLEEVKQRAAALVSESEIRKRAEEQAAEIIAVAEKEALRKREGADDYAAEVLGRLLDVVDQARGPIQRGKAQLERKNGRAGDR